MANVTLMCGSNQGDREQLLSEARFMLQTLGKIAKKSAIYKSEPWGFETENHFLNQAIIISTPYTPYEVLKITQAIETKLGRKTKSIDGNYSDRPVDIDILFYDDALLKDTPDLILPHPHIGKRRFVLEPLNELIPEYHHPENGKSISKLLEDCPDTLDVQIC